MNQYIHRRSCPFSATTFSLKETWMLFFLFLALTTLLIIKTYDTSKTATVVAATSKTTTNTQLKTYTDPAGFFTLQYPVNWTAKYKQPVTKFDEPEVEFAPYGGGSIVTIKVRPSLYNTPEEFRDTMSLMSSPLTASNPAINIHGDPAIRILGEGFGKYSIAGYDTYAITYRNYHNPARPLDGMYLISRIGYKDMSIVFNADIEEFKKQASVVQKMIDSIKITGIK